MRFFWELMMFLHSTLNGKRYVFTFILPNSFFVQRQKRFYSLCVCVFTFENTTRFISYMIYLWLFAQHTNKYTYQTPHQIRCAKEQQVVAIENDSMRILNARTSFTRSVANCSSESYSLTAQKACTITGL